MSNYCECCADDLAWLEQHLDPDGHILTYKSLAEDNADAIALALVEAWDEAGEPVDISLRDLTHIVVLYAEQHGEDR